MFHRILCSLNHACYHTVLGLLNCVLPLASSPSAYAVPSAWNPHPPQQSPQCSAAQPPHAYWPEEPHGSHCSLDLCPFTPPYGVQSSCGHLVSVSSPDCTLLEAGPGWGGVSLPAGLPVAALEPSDVTHATQAPGELLDE